MPKLEHPERIDLSTMFTDTFFNDPTIKRGKVLIFDNEGTQTHFKIVRLNRKSKVCIAEEVKLYTEDEMNAMPKEDAERIIKHGV